MKSSVTSVTPWLALFASLIVSLVAHLSRALTLTGALAATLVASAVLIGTGWAGGAVLLTFFLGGTLVSRLNPDPSRERFDAKGSRRDAAQVLANGGPAALGAVIASCFSLPPAPCTLHQVGIGLLTASLGAAAADTWATSLGARSRRLPRLITTGRPVPAGTSGALSWVGTVGALLGAGTVGLAAALAFHSMALWPFAVALGMGGMLVDSLLGAAVQARFTCPTCRIPCERPVHRCGTPAVHVQGWQWCSNDVVNALATTLAGVAGGLLYSR